MLAWTQVSFSRAVAVAMDPKETVELLAEGLNSFLNQKLGSWLNQLVNFKKIKSGWRMAVRSSGHLNYPLDSKEIKPVKSTLNIHWKDWCWNWSSNTLATWCEKLMLWERLKAGGEGDDRRPDSWMASPTQCTWVWGSSRRWWRTEKHGMLQSRGSQRVGHNLATEQQQ